MITARPAEPQKQIAAPVLPSEKRAELAHGRMVKQAQIEEDIQKWYEDSLYFAEDLARRFGNSPDHYVNQMFSGGLKLRTSQRKPNAYNAWLHHLAQAHEDEGLSVPELIEQYGAQYETLTTEEKEQYVKELEIERESGSSGLRLTQRGRTMDVNHVAGEMEKLLDGLRVRVGVEGFFCLVRSNPEFRMMPRWFFSNPDLDQFLRNSVRKFQPDTVGVLAESFCIAGSNYLSLIRNPEHKANHLKSKIRDMVQDGLVAITGDENVEMSWAQCVRDIKLPYRVELEGWTHPQFVCPSHLTNSVRVLTEIHKRFVEGKTKWVHISPERYKVIKSEYEQKLREGPTRKPRNDAGKKRKKSSKAAKPRKKRASDAVDGGEGLDDDESDDDDIPLAVSRAAPAVRN